jgi:hypothetical protein
MASQPEIRARVKEFFHFSKSELSGLLLVALITGFIFSFRDWGDEFFDVAIGFAHLIAAILLAGFTLFVRSSLQKIYALSQGYKIIMKTWFVGTYVALALSFLSLGTLSIVLPGTFTSAFMVKQRLGEFRYGFNNFENGMIGFWGIMGNIGLALFFAILAYFFPGNYIFEKGITLNLIMGFATLLPFPQLDGLKIFFGRRILYYATVGIMLLSTLLIISKTKIGLIISIILMAIGIIFFMVIGSEK